MEVKIKIKNILIILLILLIFWSASPHWINLYENGSFLEKARENENVFLFGLSCMNAVISSLILCAILFYIIFLIITSDFMDKEFNLKIPKRWK